VKSKVIEPGYGWVRVSQFQEGTAEALSKALDAMFKQSQIKGLVLDLRNDPGGLLHGAVAISSAFLPPKTLVVSTDSLGGRLVVIRDGQIVKKCFSAFIEGSSNISPYLFERGIDTLLIGGTATNICCESSARDAMMLNFKVTMVADALATYTDAEHNASLAAFYSIFGDVQTVDEAVAALDRGTSMVR
jgi:nicotinamidase-related amidase